MVRVNMEIMKIEKAVEYLENLKNKGYKLRFVTNPYNKGVIRVDYMKGTATGINPDIEIESVFIDSYKEKDEEKLTQFADEEIFGRYW